MATDKEEQSMPLRGIMETSGKDSRIDWILIVDDDEGLCELASRALMRKDTR